MSSVNQRECYTQTYLPSLIYDIAYAKLLVIHAVVVGCLVFVEAHIKTTHISTQSQPKKKPRPRHRGWRFASIVRKCICPFSHMASARVLQQRERERHNEVETNTHTPSAVSWVRVQTLLHMCLFVQCVFSCTIVESFSARTMRVDNERQGRSLTQTLANQPNHD